MKLSNSKNVSPLLPAEENKADEVYANKKAAYRAKLMAVDVTKDDLLIGSFVTMISKDIMSVEDQLDRWAAAGMNFNFAIFGYGEGAELWNSVESLYGERNILYFVSGGGLNVDEEGVAQNVSYAKGKEHCIGYFLLDEPLGSQLEDVARVSKLYRKADATLCPFVNLLPSYGGREMLGITGNASNFYPEHIANYINLVGAENLEYLSHDFYVFMENGEMDGFFGDIEAMRAAAYENGKLKTHAFPQCSTWCGMRLPNIDEMRWNVYAYLAYGFKALSWFNYAAWAIEEPDVVAPVLQDGTLSNPELYALWCDLNWEVRGLSDILKNLDTVHAYHTAELEGDPYIEILPKDFFIQPEGDHAFVISVMEPKKGTDSYIMLFNNNFSEEVTAQFTVDSLKGIKWVEYFDPFIGEHIPMMLKDGILADTFRPGEGKLYRLRYDEYVEAN